MEQENLGYEDRCLIRMNALSKIMSAKEKGKNTKNKWKALPTWQKIVFGIMIFVSFVCIAGYCVIWVYAEGFIKTKVIYLWILVTIISVMIFFSI